GGVGLSRGWGLARARGFRSKAQPHPCTALAGDLIGGIAELDASAVLFQDAADDGQTETGALVAGRDIGFEQPAAVLLGQPDPVVDHVDDDVVALAGGPDADKPAAEFLRWYRGD